jgi:sulfoxide reductase heme-binding subunit YedZ
MKPLLDSRPLLWVLLALPAVWMLTRWANGNASYGQVVSDSGVWATELLILTLAITPVRLILKRGALVSWLLRRRRDFGVATFAYAVVHTGIYLYRKADLQLILEESAETWLLVGWIALAVFVPLAVTSNDASMRRLRHAWKRLHRLVYLAAILVFAHWVLSAFDPLVAYIHIGVLASLEAARIALQLRQRVT